MFMPTVTVSSQHKLQRLIDQVERHQLHQGADVSGPREWLIKWLLTPQDDLSGRKPAYFLDHEDFDLLLVGILIKERTTRAWFPTLLRVTTTIGK